MPELPEVEANRDIVDKYLVGHKVNQIVCEEQGGGPRDGLFDDIIHEGSTKQSLTNAVMGRMLLRAGRKGKQMWLEFSAPIKDNPRGSSAVDTAGTVDSCLLMHFGMTGALVVQGRQASSYKSFKVHDSQWPPRFCKLELLFSNGDRLAYCDPRRIGRIRVKGKYAAEEPPINQLATDALEEIEPQAFSQAMRASTLEIKVALLNQEKLVSGIGNWLADEILYQCCIHPQVRCCDLTDVQAQEIGSKINQVCRIAAACTCGGKEFPENWLFHYRWTKASSTKSHDAAGNAITFETVGGRTSAIVLALQPKPTKTGTSKAKTKTAVKGTKNGTKKIEMELETSPEKPKSSKYLEMGSGSTDPADAPAAPALVKTEKRARPAPAKKGDSGSAKRTKR